MSKLGTEQYMAFHAVMKDFEELIIDGHIGENIEEAVYSGSYYDLFKALVSFDIMLPTWLFKSGVSFRVPRTTVVISEDAENQMCHKIAALDYVRLNATAPGRYSIWTGIVDRYYAHSWVFDAENNTIIEPTPLARTLYFGIKVEDPSYLTDFYTPD